ncbi:MAG: YciI family protein [Terriglobales bacterium]|jgi:hypothetical protein
MKYICLGYYNKSKHDAMTEAERQAMFDACFTYDDHLRANGHWVGGEPIEPVETALTLYCKNGNVATTDGPYAETKEQVGGILILEARDMNQTHQLIPPSLPQIRRHFRDTSGRRPQRNAEGQRAAPTAEGCTLKFAGQNTNQFRLGRSVNG